MQKNENSKHSKIFIKPVRKNEQIIYILIFNKEGLILQNAAKSPSNIKTGKIQLIGTFWFW